MRSNGQPNKPDTLLDEQGGSPISEPNTIELGHPDSLEQPTSGHIESEISENLNGNLATVQPNLTNGMRNQMSSSRAMTVELNTLKDMTPKLMREINTYTIGECQHIKELEKSLPFCREHKDVRFNLVLEEIHRLRANRSRTLDKLKETHVKIAELEFRLELASFQAGEIFWDQKLSELAKGSSINAANLHLTNNSREFQPNFEFAPVVGLDKLTAQGVHKSSRFGIDSSASTQRTKAMENSRGQGLIEYGNKVIVEPQEADIGGIRETLIESIENFKDTKEVRMTGRQEFVQPINAPDAIMQSLATPSQKVDRSSSPKGLMQNPEQDPVTAERIKPSYSDSFLTAPNATADPASTEIDELINQVKESKQQSSRFHRRLLLFSAIPATTAVVLFVLEWQTKLFSNLFHIMPK